MIITDHKIRAIDVKILLPYVTKSLQLSPIALFSWCSNQENNTGTKYTNTGENISTSIIHTPIIMLPKCRIYSQPEFHCTINNEQTPIAVYIAQFSWESYKLQILCNTSTHKSVSHHDHQPLLEFYTLMFKWDLRVDVSIIKKNIITEDGLVPQLN